MTSWQIESKVWKAELDLSRHDDQVDAWWLEEHCPNTAGDLGTIRIKQVTGNHNRVICLQMLADATTAKRHLVNFRQNLFSE